MILLLGGAGYVSSAFQDLFRTNKVNYVAISRGDVDYYDPDILANVLRDSRATFLVNAAGFTGKPNVDACELCKADCLLGNAVLPGMIRKACESCKIPWGHVSSGCIFTGHRSDGSGFTELDEPNFSFRRDNSSFYSGTKALGEECLRGAERTYVWRLRIPFSNIDSPRNYLSKLQHYDRLLDARNSLSHLGEFVRACFECWSNRIPFGTYNVTNPGSITTREIVAILKRRFPAKSFEFFADEDEFMRSGVNAPRSNCVLDSSKLLASGISLTPVRLAIERSVSKWQAFS